MKKGRKKVQELQVEVAKSQISLLDLQMRISRREVIIDEWRQKTETDAGNLIQQVIDQGNDLIVVKAIVGHGDFMGWVAKNFAKTHRTATQYMATATKWQHVSNLKPESLRQVYQAIGLLPAPNESTASVGITLDPVFQKLNTLTEVLNKERDLFASWTEQKRAELRDRLKPLVELYQTL